MFGLKKSAEAGVKEAIKAKNPLAGCITLTAADCDTGEIISVQAIKKSDLEKAAKSGVGVAVDGITIMTEAPKTEKEPSKVKEVASDLGSATVLTGKALIVKVEDGAHGIKNFFTNMAESIKHNAERLDQKKVEKAQAVVDAAKKTQA